MTRDEMRTHIWRKLGAKKWLVGRREVSLLTELAIENWQGDEMTATADEAESVANRTTEAVYRARQAIGSKDRQQEYGTFWVTLLISIIAAIVQALLRWWLERRENRTTMLVWQQEGMQ